MFHRTIQHHLPERKTGKIGSWTIRCSQIGSTTPRRPTQSMCDSKVAVQVVALSLLSHLFKVPSRLPLNTMALLPSSADAGRDLTVRQFIPEQCWNMQTKYEFCTALKHTCAKAKFFPKNLGFLRITKNVSQAAFFAGACCICHIACTAYTMHTSHPLYTRRLDHVNNLPQNESFNFNKI